MGYIASNIKFLRKSVGLSQSQFARQFGLTRGMVASYEGASAIPKLYVLNDIANHFDIKLDEIVNKDLNALKPYERKEDVKVLMPNLLLDPGDPAYHKVPSYAKNILEEVKIVQRDLAALKDAISMLLKDKKTNRTS